MNTKIMFSGSYIQNGVSQMKSQVIPSHLQINCMSLLDSLNGDAHLGGAIKALTNLMHQGPSPHLSVRHSEAPIFPTISRRIRGGFSSSHSATLYPTASRDQSQGPFGRHLSRRSKVVAWPRRSTSRRWCWAESTGSACLCSPDDWTRTKVDSLEHTDEQQRPHGRAQYLKMYRRRILKGKSDVVSNVRD